MFIGLLRTKNNKVCIEHFTFEEALQSLNRRIDDRPPGSIVEALILDDEGEDLDDQCPDFNSCKVVASLRTLR